MKKLYFLIVTFFITLSIQSQKDKLVFDLEAGRGSASDVVLEGAEEVRQKRFRGSSFYRFDGEDDFAQIQTGLLDVDSGGSFLIETLIKPEPTSGYWKDYFGVETFYEGGAIFSLYACSETSNPHEPDLFIVSYTNDGTVTVSHRTADGVTDVLSVPMGESLFSSYHHIAVMRFGKRAKLCLFIDGEKEGELMLNDAGALRTYPVYIGKYRPCTYNQATNPNQKDANYFKGEIQFLRVYHRAFKPRKIFRMYRKAMRRVVRKGHSHQGGKEEGHNEGTEEEHQTDWNKWGSTIRVYPNPSCGIINIAADGDGWGTSLRVVDACGRVVYESTFSNQIDLRFLSRGHYRLLFITNDRVFSRMLIIR